MKNFLKFKNIFFIIIILIIVLLFSQLLLPYFQHTKIFEGLTQPNDSNANTQLTTSTSTATPNIAITNPSVPSVSAITPDQHNQLVVNSPNQPTPPNIVLVLPPSTPSITSTYTSPDNINIPNITTNSPNSLNSLPLNGGITSYNKY